VLVANNISKVYRIYRQPIDRLKEALWFGYRDLHEDFWALRNVSFEVNPGETMGIVGANGSGKSTLLQILAGILEPTTGRVSREGRVAALLELGAGFNPEFSGRENIFINGEIMGLSRREIERAMPSIEHFAGIGNFIERPVKTYSSGMYVRLAFSTAIHVEPEILIVDEALAVGDAVFANRCVRKFKELQQAGVTIVFVSHDLGLVKQICNRAIFLEDGQIVERGDPSTTINRYVGTVLERQKAYDTETDSLQERSGDKPTDLDFSHRHGDRAAEVTEVELLNAAGLPTRAVSAGEKLRVRVVSKFNAEQPSPMVGMLIRTRNGLDVFGTNTSIENADVGPCAAGEEVAVEFSFECWLTAQEYTLTVATQYAEGYSHDWLDDVITFQVVDARPLAGVANLHPQVECTRAEVIRVES
jgi:ABC-type polysaccharide/polyol phosphate transport system ATPase subunit